MSDETSEAGALLTSDINEFIAELRDGDVLLFDRLHPVSNMIKLADNSPVSHAGLFQSAGNQLIHASPPSAGAFAVRRESLHNRLAEREDRTVTALRHANEDLGSAVLTEANRWLEKETHYAFKYLLDLAASCFNRSYGRPISNARDRTSAQKFHERALRRMSLVMRALTVLALGDSDDGPWSVTCSEFVYSCHIGADPASIEISDPLAEWSDGGPTKVYLTDPTARGGSPRVARMAPGDETDESERKILFTNPDEAPTAAPVARTDGDSVADILGDERYELDEERRRNQLWSKPEFRATGQDPAPYAQAVTPFDLWQSPSFTAVRVLHQPPTGADPVRQRRGTDRER